MRDVNGARQLVEDWKAGKTVRVVEMGGLGTGYEVAIYEMAMAGLEKLLNECQSDPSTWNNDEDNVWVTTDRPLLEQALTEASEGVGATGAQYGAAGNIAAIYYRQGYAKAMEMAPAERIIELSRDAR